MSEQRAKYGNKKTTVDGITFDSKKEAVRYGELKLLKKANLIDDFELQPEFDYYVTYSANEDTYTVVRRYIADFKVINKDGSIEIEDVKGCKTTEYKRKKKIVEKLYGIKIIEL